MMRCFCLNVWNKNIHVGRLEFNYGDDVMQEWNDAERWDGFIMHLRLIPLIIIVITMPVTSPANITRVELNCG